MEIIKIVDKFGTPTEKEIDTSYIRQRFVIDGISGADIAKEIGCSVFSTYKLINKYNFKRNQNVRKKFRTDISRYIDSCLKEIIWLYETKELSFGKLGELFHIDATTILNRLIQQGIKTRKYSRLNHFNRNKYDIIGYTQANLKQMIHLYDIEQKSMLEISRILHISRTTIKGYLLENGVKLRTQSETIKSYAKKNPFYSKEKLLELKDWFTELQKTLYSIKNISKETGYKREFISSLLDNKLTHNEIFNGMKKKNIYYMHRIKLENKKDEIIDLYYRGYSTISIGRMYGCSAQVINRRLRLWGVELREGRYHIKKDWLRCDSGLFVRSDCERQVCNWLFHHQIIHQYDGEICSDARYRYDFKVGEYYIEVWGLIGVDEYEERMRKKLIIYNNNRLKLISLFPKDDINAKLSFLIPLYSKVQTTLKEYI